MYARLLFPNLILALFLVAEWAQHLGTSYGHLISRRHLQEEWQPLKARDASTLTSGGTNNEGEAHGPIVAPSGSVFTSLNVGQGGEQIAAYWTQNPKNNTATQAFIMIHGRMRDGDAYWTTMNNVLNTAVQGQVSGADPNSIVVAPEFFSTIFNSGQYANQELAWDDVNGWQAADVATHPVGTKLTSFDALDAFVAEFANSAKYPALKNLTIVGHGGGGQLIQRYSMAAGDSPSNLHIRYIHGDPSSCAYFTTDRLTAMSDGDVLPSKVSCPLYNTWRYGFDNFTGTATGLLSTQDYFKQYITRDIVSIVGYQDVDASGDTYCMAEMQGGTKRRDRNLAWWQYVNTLARTNEDLNGFPGTYVNLPDWSNISNNKIQLQLVVVENADHNADEVFASSEGQAALFSSNKMPTGWRPSGWVDNSAAATSTNTSGHSSTASRVKGAASSVTSTSTSNNGHSLLHSNCYYSMIIASVLIILLSPTLLM